MSGLKPVKITATLYWTKYMSQFNTHFDEDNNRYECTLGDLSPAACEALQEQLGIKIKNKEGQGNYIVAKSKLGFKPVDLEGHPVDVTKIGAGTKVTALMKSYTHKMSKMHGNAPSVYKLIITDLKVYDPNAEIREALEDDMVL